MEAPQMLRFVQNHQSDKLPSGVYRRYQIRRESDQQILLTCDMEKSFLGGTTTLISSDQSRAFLHHKGGGWVLKDDAGQIRGNIAQASLFGNGWQVSPIDGNDIIFGDPSKFSERVIRSALNGAPDSYAGIENGQETGVISRKPRDDNEGGKPGILGKLRKLMQTRDWVLSRDIAIAENQFLFWVAGVLAIIEVTAHGDRS